MLMMPFNMSVIQIWRGGESLEFQATILPMKTLVTGAIGIARVGMALLGSARLLGK